MCRMIVKKKRRKILVPRFFFRWIVSLSSVVLSKTMREKEGEVAEIESERKRTREKVGESMPRGSWILFFSLLRFDYRCSGLENLANVEKAVADYAALKKIKFSLLKKKVTCSLICTQLFHVEKEEK